MRGARRTGRVVAGIAVWVGLLVGLVLLGRTRAAELGPPAAELSRWATRRPLRVEVDLVAAAAPSAVTSVALAVGDPVLDWRRRVLGRIESLSVDGTSWGWVHPGTRCRAVLVIDPEVTLPEAARFQARTAPRESATWVVETLLPEHKRELLVRELKAFASEHQAEIVEFLRPLAEEVVAHGMKVLESNLAPALQKHEAEIKKLLDEQRDKVKDDVLPVLKSRLGPSARKRLDPVVRKIGAELRKELPMWTIGWNAALDVIPGTSQDRLEKWWGTFVDEKVVPIIAAHETDLMRAFEQLLEEGIADPEVRKAFAKASARLANDARFKQIVRKIIEDALVRPFDAPALMSKLLDDPAHRARLDRLQQAFAPTLRRVGQQLTIDPETGRIDPDLARVLRRVVFDKDARWVELLEGPAR